MILNNMKDTLIAENEKCFFYTNMMTTDFKDGYRILLVKHKDNEHLEYLLIYNNEPIFASQKIEEIWNKHDICKLIESKK